MDIREKVFLNEWTWWKIGGPADFFCLPGTLAQVLEAVNFAHTRGLPVTVLGGGTNVLVSDLGVEGLVICMRKLAGVESEEREGRLRVTVLAGTPKSELTKLFLKRKLAPALFLCGLPGDVGGGLVMNAGVAENVKPRELSEIVEWVEFLDLNSLGVQHRRCSELKWEYRKSSGWQPGIFLRAGIVWPLDVDDEIPQKVKAATRLRLQKQPLELPSCGSTFKNPPGTSAGALIDRAGLKGYRVGGAEVSTKHANFIVNRGGAAAEDVRQIIVHVRDEVKKRTGLLLETEVKWMGRW